MASPEPLRLIAALAEGERMPAVRYSSDLASPALFDGAADPGGALVVPLAKVMRAQRPCAAELRP
jgi:hypothetical protein